MSVILNLYLNKITDILDPDVDVFVRLVHVLDRITNNIVDHTAQLLRIRDNQRIRRRIVEVGQSDAFCLKIKSNFFHTILEILIHIQLCKIVRNTIRINLGIKCQFIDKHIHLVSFIVYGSHIFINFFRRIRHSVNNSFRITLDRSNRCLEIMCDIADQSLILTLIVNLLLRVILKALPHLLKSHAKFSNLIVPSGIHLKVKVAFLDVLRCSLQLLDRRDHTLIDPDDHHACCQKQD